MHTQHLKSISKIYTRLKTHFWRDILPVTPMNVCRIKIINAILRFCFFFPKDSHKWNIDFTSHNAFFIQNRPLNGNEKFKFS